MICSGAASTRLQNLATPYMDILQHHACPICVSLSMHKLRGCEVCCRTLVLSHGGLFPGRWMFELPQHVYTQHDSLVHLCRPHTEDSLKCCGGSDPRPDARFSSARHSLLSGQHQLKNTPCPAPVTTPLQRAFTTAVSTVSLVLTSQVHTSPRQTPRTALG